MERAGRKRRAMKGGKQRATLRGEKEDRTQDEGYETEDDALSNTHIDVRGNRQHIAKRGARDELHATIGKEAQATDTDNGSKEPSDATIMRLGERNANSKKRPFASYENDKARPQPRALVSGGRL
jgi:hypothetical protein